jgi:hypothetical protein
MTRDAEDAIVSCLSRVAFSFVILVPVKRQQTAQSWNVAFHPEPNQSAFLSGRHNADGPLANARRRTVKMFPICWQMASQPMRRCRRCREPRLSLLPCLHSSLLLTCQFPEGSGYADTGAGSGDHRRSPQHTRPFLSLVLPKEACRMVLLRFLFFSFSLTCTALSILVKSDSELLYQEWHSWLQ